jgi:superfamily I DNA/RNA helicase
MKITKRQLRRIIKEETSHLLNESTQHPYDLAVERAYEIHGRSNTDVADEISIDVSDILGHDHPLAQRIEYLIDRQEDDFEDLLDEIDWAVEDGSAPADIKDRLMNNGNFE